MPESAPLTTSSRVYYASGGMATGIINNGFNSFVLLYYSNVLGVPAGYGRQRAGHRAGV